MFRISAIGHVEDTISPGKIPIIVADDQQGLAPGLQCRNDLGTKTVAEFGVLIGSQFTIRVPDRALRGVLAGVLVLSGLKLLDVPGSTVIVIVALCGGLFAGVAILVAQFVRRRRAVPVAEPAAAAE